VKTLTLAKVLMMMGFFGWVSYLCLTVYYGFSRPTVAQPEVGRTHAVDNHGHVAFLTNREVANLHLLLETSGGLIAIAVAVGLFAKLRQRSNA
jgi:hypothetical protein